jgi:VanZ family protein
MRIRYLLPPIIWAAIILFLCLMPSREMPELNIWAFISFDKLAHIFFYTLLSVQLIVAFKKQSASCALRYNAISYAVLISIVYGIITEMLQYYMFAGRSADVVDVIANSLGSVLGAGTFYVLYKQPIRQ